MAQVTCPGNSEVMLLSSSLLTFLPVWPAGPFSFTEPAGSCLTAAELLQSSAFFLPYWALLAQACWSCLAGRPSSGPPLVGLTCVGPVTRPWQPPAGAMRVPGFPTGPPLSPLLLGSGSTGGVNGRSCSPHTSPVRVTAYPALLSLRVCSCLSSRL